MTDARVLRRMGRLDEEFPGLLATLQKALKGLVPDDANFTEDSYDELFIILVAAIYLVQDPPLRRKSADRSGGNPRLVAMLMDEGEKDKDAVLVEKILDRLAPYTPVKEVLDSMARMHASKEPLFHEYCVPIQRIASDLWRITMGFEPAPKCPKSLLRWAMAHRAALYTELFGA